MDALNRVIEQIVTPNMTTSHSSKPCSICGEDVPAIEVDIIGTKRWVQPKCKCEVDARMEKVRAIEQAKEASEIRSLFSISDIGEKYLTANFHDFIQRPGSENAYKAAAYYAQHFEEFGSESVMLWGDPGNGKTMLAACVHNHLVKQDKKVVFVSMPDLLSKIKSTFNRNNPQNESDILKALTLCDLLVIDDLGAEKTSDWVQEKVFEIIDARYRRQKPILATSNLKPTQLSERIGKRACDRLLEMSQPIENKASSYRVQIAAKRISKFDEILRGDV